MDLATLNILLLLHPHPSMVALVANNTIAVALAIVNSYIWNTRWTFRGEATGSTKERALFAAQALINILINNTVLLILANALPVGGGPGTLVASNLAKLVAMFASSSVSFACLRLVVFTRRRPRTPPGSSANRGKRA